MAQRGTGQDRVGWQGKARRDKAGWDGTGQGRVQQGEASHGGARQEKWCKNMLTGAKTRFDRWIISLNISLTRQKGRKFGDEDFCIYLFSYSVTNVGNVYYREQHFHYTYKDDFHKWRTQERTWRKRLPILFIFVFCHPTQWAVSRYFPTSCLWHSDRLFQLKKKFLVIDLMWGRSE